MAAAHTAGADVHSARDLVGEAIRSSVDRLAVELPRARAGDDPEGVHQARVATRRLRSDLRTFGPLLDEAWRVQRRADLRRLTDALGRVRDTDVRTIDLERAIGADRVGQADALLARLRAERADAHEALVTVIDDPRTSQLIDRLHEAAERPPTTPIADGRPRRRLRPLVARPWKQLRRAVHDLPDDPPIGRLHEIRLLAKRVRYAAEAVTPVFGRESKRFASAVARLQDTLGDLNDASQLAEWLTAAAPELDAPAAFAAGQLVAELRREVDEHRLDWRDHFERARRRSAWLAG